MPSISQEQVKLWTDQAKKTLEKAREICTISQSLLHRTSYQLTVFLPDKLATTTLLMDTMSQQQQKLGRTVNAEHQLVKQRAEEFRQKISLNIKPALAQLDNIVLQLQYTKVPAFLIQDAQDYSNLAEFISIGSIHLLRLDIAIYESKGEKLYSLLEATLNDQVLTQYHQVVSKQYKKLFKSYEEDIPTQLGMKLSSIDSKVFVNTLLKENGLLEQELIDVLQMLTRHYDQCVEGLSLFRGDVTQVNLEVLEHDAYELPEILKDLNSIYKVIVDNETRALQFLKQCFTQINSLTASIRDQLQLYRTLRSESLVEVAVLRTTIDETLSKNSKQDDKRHPIDAYSDTVKQLAFHYTQFLDIFKSHYLTELHYEKYVYPRKFLSKLSKFLDDELYGMQHEESERRKKWLAKYGEYIPKELKLPGLVNQPAVVQVVTEGLEEVDEQNEPDSKNEIFLLKLINSSK